MVLPNIHTIDPYIHQQITKTTLRFETANSGIQFSSFRVSTFNRTKPHRTSHTQSPHTSDTQHVTSTTGALYVGGDGRNQGGDTETADRVPRYDTRPTTVYLLLVRQTAAAAWTMFCVFCCCACCVRLLLGHSSYYVYIEWNWFSSSLCVVWCLSHGTLVFLV